MSVHSDALAPGELARAVALVSGLERVEPDAARRARLLRVLDVTAGHVSQGARAVIGALPPAFRDAMEPYGWLWNGFYGLDASGRLLLGPACGPPVCAELLCSGGPLSSGMCFDALFFNQTLAAFDVKSWPGYVSCDAESGLRTVAGIVAPLRDPTGRAIGVWDLDATAPVSVGDVRFVEALFSVLARTVAIRPEDLAP